eukprot:8565410-Pyramimonas_sp.AAC.1
MFVLRWEWADLCLLKALLGPSSAILKPSRGLRGLAEAVLWASRDSGVLGARKSCSRRSIGEHVVER